MNTEQRLTQVEKLTETIARYIDRHEQRFEQTQAEMDQLRTQMGEVLQIFTELAQYQRQSQAEMAEYRQQIQANQAQIQANQAEIRRIWEYLLNQNTNGHDSDQ